MENETNTNETREQLTDQEVLDFINKDNDTVVVSTTKTNDTILSEISKEDIREIYGDDAANDVFKNEEANILTAEDHKERVVLDFNRIFDFDSKTLAKLIERSEITSEEKDRYMRSVLLNVPLHLDIKLNKSKIKFNFKTKTVYETELITRLLRNTQTWDDTQDINYQDFIFNINLAISLKKIDDNTCDFLSNTDDITIDTDLDTFRTIIYDRLKHIKAYNNALYNMVKIGLFMFNYKEKLLGEFMLNEDFC